MTAVPVLLLVTQSRTAVPVTGPGPMPVPVHVQIQYRVLATAILILRATNLQLCTMNNPYRGTYHITVEVHTTAVESHGFRV